MLVLQASLDGTHPHQWTPPSVHDYFLFENGSFGAFPFLIAAPRAFLHVVLQSTEWEGGEPGS